MADGNAKHNAYASIARGWANNDVTEASSWLMGLPAGSSKDSAISAFSYQVFEEDPSAATQWAESIGDANSRQSTVFSLLSRWERSDPAAAATAIQQSSLTPDQQNQLLQRGAH